LGASQLIKATTLIYVRPQVHDKLQCAGHYHWPNVEINPHEHLQPFTGIKEDKQPANQPSCDVTDGDYAFSQMMDDLDYLL